MTADQARYYLAAIIDGEGTVSVKYRKVSITNTDVRIVEACESCCKLLGLSYAVYRRKKTNKKWKQAFDLVIIGRENLSTVVSLPMMTGKKVKVASALGSYRRHPVPPKEILEHLYCEVKLSLKAIGNRYGGRPASTVRYWLEKYGIERRSPSEAAALDWSRRT
jgi:hypothetical protein